jgi:hypothetical protein
VGTYLCDKRPLHQHDKKNRENRNGRTIVVRADVEATGLAGGNGLRQAEEGRAEGADTILKQDGTSVHGRAGAGDFNAEAILGDADFLKLTCIGTSVLDNLVGVVSVERRCLQKDATLNIPNVLGAEEGALIL